MRVRIYCTNCTVVRNLAAIFEYFRLLRVFLNEHSCLRVMVRHNPVDDQNERLLVQRALTDVEAFHQLYDIYFPRIYGYVASRVSDEREVEDIVSDIFLQSLRQLSQLKNRYEYSFGAWLFTIAHNKVVTFYRTQERDRAQMFLDGKSYHRSDASPLESAVIEHELLAELRHLLHILPDRRREVVILRYFGGLRNQEIARMLSLDERTVASHLSRGLRDLYTAYTQKSGINPGVRNEPK